MLHTVIKDARRIGNVLCERASKWLKRKNEWVIEQLMIMQVYSGMGDVEAGLAEPESCWI